MERTKLFVAGKKEVVIDTPKFVADVVAFEKACQHELDRITVLGMQEKVTSKLNSFSKALKESVLTLERFSELMKAGTLDGYEKVFSAFTNWDAACKDLASFEKEVQERHDGEVPTKCINRPATAFMWAMFNSSIELPLTGYDNLKKCAIEYGHKYLGTESWTATRKTDFGKLRDMATAILNTTYNFSEEDYKGMYKKVPVAQFPAKHAEIVVNAIYGRFDTNNAGGIEIKHLKGEAGKKQLLLSFFHWKGCDTSIITSTKNKATAW